MADRAQYLARRLIRRLAELESGFAEDGRGEPDRGERIAAIEKVLAVELGLVDGATMALIEAAVPGTRPGAPAIERDVAAFADFLRIRLGPQLEP